MTTPLSEQSTLGELRRLLVEDPSAKEPNEFLKKSLRIACARAISRGASPEDALDIASEILEIFWTRMRSQCTSWLEPGDFKDCEGFLEKLQGRVDALSQSLYEKLSVDTRQRVDAYSPPQPPDDVLISSLARDLNRMMCQQRLDAPTAKGNRWVQKAVGAQLTLSDAGQEQEALPTLETEPELRTLLRSNRSLLAEAYPGVFEKAPKEYDPAIPVGAFLNRIINTHVTHRLDTRNYSKFRSHSVSLNQPLEENEGGEILQDSFSINAANPEKIVCLRDALHICKKRHKLEERRFLDLRGQGHTAVEIASLLQMPQGPVRNDLSRALKAFRACLEEHGALEMVMSQE